MVHHRIDSIHGPTDITRRLAELGIRSGVAVTKMSNGLIKVGGMTVALRLPPTVVITYQTTHSN